METFLITGGCGYIGSHISKLFKIVNPECKIAVVDLVSRDHTLKYVDEFIQCDYSSTNTFDLIDRINPSAIIHCAGTSLVGPSNANPSEYYNNNVIKTIQLLDFIKNRNISFIFSSSASVYGNPTTSLISEGHSTNPISVYGRTKLTIENVIKDYSNAYKLKSVSLRYFNAAGADLDRELGQELGATHIIARVIESALTDEQFILNGDTYDTKDGTCIRDYVHVWDLATAHFQAYKFLKNSLENTCVFNVGTSEGISNYEIINYAISHYNLNPKIIIGGKRDGDPDQLVADSSQARSLLKWNSSYSNLPVIMNSAYNWYKKVLI